MTPRAPSANPALRIAPAPDAGGVLKDFVRDETGAVFLEFLIVLFSFLFILFGVIQVALIAMASFFTHYANFMALRTAAVQYELFEDDFISESDFENKCRDTAAAALGPMEAYVYHHDFDILAKFWLRQRVNFEYEADAGAHPGGGGPAPKPVVIKGHLEYDYYLIVPFAGNVIAAFGKGKNIPSDERVMQEYAWEGGNQGIFGKEPYPLLRLRSNNDLSTEGGAPPHPHEMLIQRRWNY
jgi:hypothetical protein